MKKVPDDYSDFGFFTTKTAGQDHKKGFFVKTFVKFSGKFSENKKQYYFWHPLGTESMRLQKRAGVLVRLENRM